MGLNAPKLKKIMIKKESFILGGVQNWFSQYFKREHLQKCLFSGGNESCFSRLWNSW